MDNEQIWTYGFFAFVACSGISTFCVFQMTKTKGLWSKVIMRAAALSLFYSPCILAGEGGAAIAPVGVVYLFILNGILPTKTYLVGAISWMTISFFLCSWYLFRKYMSR